MTADAGKYRCSEGKNSGRLRNNEWTNRALRSTGSPSACADRSSADDQLLKIVLVDRHLTPTNLFTRSRSRSMAPLPAPAVTVWRSIHLTRLSL
jgi:hypothetical protein